VFRKIGKGGKKSDFYWLVKCQLNALLRIGGKWDNG